MSEMPEIRALLREFFGNDPKKIELWLDTKNPLLGGLSPMEMVHVGREEKLLEFVKTSLAENERSEE